MAIIVFVNDFIWNKENMCETLEHFWAYGGSPAVLMENPAYLQENVSFTSWPIQKYLVLMFHLKS